jgi:P-type Ca2+ transporter type 2C
MAALIVATVPQRALFVNPYLWGAIALSAALQILVVHVTVLTRAFGTASLSGGEWLFCVVMASIVLWIDKLEKLITRLAGLRG